MLIIRRVVPHKQQRYDTYGDWEFGGCDTLIITVSKQRNKRHQLLGALHEQIEAELCRAAGIDQDDVTAFDVAYEECRKLNVRAPCGCELWDDPGSDIHAPYREQHLIARECEKLMAKGLGVDWNTYDNEEVD